MNLTVSEILERILIDLYESAMLHGESQANGVGVTLPHREQTILLAERQINELLEEAYKKGHTDCGVETLIRSQPLIRVLEFLKETEVKDET